MSRPASLRSELALLFTVLVWGVNFVAVKAALAVMPPHGLNLFRFIVSTTVLGGLYAVQQKKARASLFSPLKGHLVQLIGLGLLGFLFYQYCFIVGVNYTTAGSAALIMASAPLWTAVLGHVFGFDRLRIGAWVGLAVTLAGAMAVVVGGAGTIDFGHDALLGNVLMLLAALLWGAYTAFSKPLSRTVTPVSISFLGLLAALPFLIGLGLPTLASVRWEQVDWWVWGAILFSGGLSTGVAIAIWNTAVMNVGPSQTAVYGNLVPVVALLCGTLFLGEAITPVQLTGGALILGGLLVMRRSRQPRLVPSA